MITIYHNPRCRKSREGVQFLEEQEKKFTIVKYLEDKLSYDELSNIINQLDIAPLDLVRKNEKDWKENFKDKTLSNQEIIQAMVNFPKLIERPIIVYKNKAVIGRPATRILDLF